LQRHINLEPAGGGSETDSREISRADFFKVTAVAGGAVALGGVLLKGNPESANAASSTQDSNILNFLLVMEYLQAAFYQDAVDKGALTGDLARFAQVVGAHEKAHVNFLRRKLGSRAGSRPSFDFGSATASENQFAATAVRLEELGLGAYVGQGANLSRKQVLQVGRITSVEGRHAAWIRDIQRQPPAPLAADKGASQSKVAAALRETGFITGGGQ
jgi:hypothetical protein